MVVRFGMLIRDYFDFSFMGVGTNILGYSRKEIDNEVISKIKLGNMSTLNSPEEVLLAEKLISINLGLRK